ncbi:MAG: hypothetical protein LIP08_12405 [Bacteroides sp.]|nr:hypothetical protein [Bacteroides sp.]
MELDELKQSWRKLDEHLEDKELVREGEIRGLMRHTSGKIRAFETLSRKMIVFTSLLILLVTAGVFYTGLSNNLHYVIVIIIAIPAIGWDLYTLRYLRQTRIEEMSLVEIVTRVNRLHTWAIREQFAVVPLILCVAVGQFISRHVWEESIGMLIAFFVIWISAIGLGFWVQRKFLINRIREIKKNLDEIREINEINNK